MVLDNLLSEARAARLSDDYPTAMRLARAVLAATPGVPPPEAESLLGICEVETGDIASGAPRVEKALRAKPDSPWLNLNLSILREAQGDIRGAVVAASAATRFAPDHYETWTALGRILGRAGKYGEAAAALKTAFKLNPAHSGVARLYAGAAIEAGDLGGAEAAVAALERDVASAPDLVKLRLGLYKKRGDWTRLESEARRVISTLPDDEVAHLALAESLSRRGRYDDAVEALRKLAPTPSTLTAFGHVMLANKHYKKAQASFDEAIEKDPQCADALLGRCRLYIELGDLRAAETDCRAAISAGAPSAESYAQLKELTAGRFTKDELTSLCSLAEDSPESSRGLALFTVGDVLHARGDYRAAFDSWTAGNRAAAASDARANETYDPGALQAVCARMRSLFPDDSGASIDAPDSALAPVFLLSLPLSGAAELEEALSAHPDIASAGEVPILPRILDGAMRWAEQTGWAGGELPEKEAAEWREAYYFGRARFIRRPGAFVVDREPSNFVGAGLARLLFPEARFICLRRDLMAWALLAYRSPLSRAFPFATDLASIAQHAAEYARLCAHWAACFGPQFSFVQYEDLVADGGGELRRLTEFLSLPPQDGLFETYLRRERVIGAARGLTVRRPFASDSDEHAAYAERLQPVADALRRAGVDPASGRYVGRIH